LMIVPVCFFIGLVVSGFLIKETLVHDTSDILAEPSRAEI